MNQIATRQPETIARNFVMPEISDALDDLLMPTVHRSGPDDAGVRIARRTPSMADIAEARDALYAIGPQMGAEPSRSLVRSWLMPINAAVRNPQSGGPDGDFDARAAVIAMACGDLPAWAFNRDTQAEALRTFKFWPAASDVRDLLLKHAQPALDRVTALHRVASYQPTAKTAPAAPELTPEAREAEALAVKLKGAAIRAELSAGTDRAVDPAKAPLLGAKHATDEMMLRIYEAEPKPHSSATLTRIAMLRTKLDVR